MAYNVVSNFDTFRSNSSFLLSQFPSRLHALRITWDGEILWDYMVHAPWAAGAAREPETTLEDISDTVHSVVGVRYHYHNEMEPAFWVGLALVPLLWLTRARRTLLFCLIAMLVAWIQMAITKDAGLGAHHVSLLWPLPQWFLAVAFVQAAAWRPLRWRNAGTILLASGGSVPGRRKFAADERVLLPIVRLWTDQELDTMRSSSSPTKSGTSKPTTWWWTTGEF